MCWFVHSGARSCEMHRLLQTFGLRTTMIGTRLALRVCAKNRHSPRRNYRGGSGLLVIVAKPGEQFYTDAVGQRAHPSRINTSYSTPKHVGGEWRAPCRIRDATAIARQSVCWRLKKHANLIIANFISLWPSHGSRSPGRMRQQTICSRAGNNNKPIREPAIGRH
jgi:hypothetical protein